MTRPTPTEGSADVSTAERTDGITPPGDAALDVIAFHHHPVKAPLLREVMLPLAAACAADGITAHVERHWLHGPHLRLRLQGPPARVEAAAAAAASRIRDWLHAHPSRGDLTESQLLERAAEAGRAELVPRPTGRSSRTTPSASTPSTAPRCVASSATTAPPCARTCCAPGSARCGRAPGSSPSTGTPRGRGSSWRWPRSPRTPPPTPTGW